MYVIQYAVWRNGYKTGSWLPYTVGGVPKRYPTLEQALNAFSGMSKLEQVDSRIAEEYTVTRYKAVRRDVL